ncbi:MAG: hypothetical protein HZA04_04995 [Nitrospinae bacterium]|nr:hypothetical protein [Nitrospinota bacterium]
MTIAITLTAIAAFLCKLPFLRFPMDEDFAFYTYVPHFRKDGIRVKKDYLALLPAWRTNLLSLVYGNGGWEKGVFRIRLALALAHAATALVVLWAGFALTHSVWAAAAAGLLYALFGTAPALSCHTVNMEQVYLPFALGGMVMFLDGSYEVSALMFGVAAIPKIASGIYVPPLTLLLWHRADLPTALAFALISAIPSAISLAADLLAGYGDAESRNQIRTRLAVAVRLPKLKTIYGSIRDDIRAIVHETLPVWVIGAPALAFVPFTAEGMALSLFILITLSMIWFQGGYSRYHYLPVVALLCVATAAGLSHAGQFAAGIMAAFAAASLLTAFRLFPFYARPLHPRTLARYDKFDQYLYLPRLGKALGRLMKMRKENGRIFVWGNFTQLYQYAGRPASDEFIHYAVGPWNDERLAGYFDTIIGGIMRHRPLYIIKSFPDFDMELVGKTTGLRYRLLKIWLGRFPVYRMVSVTTPAQDPLTLDWRKKMDLMEQLTKGKHTPCMVENGQPPRTAIKECRRLIRLNYSDTEGLFHLARLYEEAGIEDSELATLFKRLIDERPGQKMARLALAKLCIKGKDTATAALYIADEERLFGVSASTLFYRGHLLKGAGEPQKAAETFAELCRREPLNGEYALYRAECLHTAGEYAEARRSFLRAWDMGEQQEWIRTRAALGIAALDAPEKREHETIGEFMAKDAKNLPLAYARASALERDGRAEAARKEFSDIAASDAAPDIKGAALFRLARLSANGARAGLARQCLKILPHHGGARELLKNG